jgi:hypothetical protein
MLKVLTLSFRPPTSQKWGGYMTSFMHVFSTNKIPLVVRPALHPATIRVPTITTSSNTLWMDRIRCGYVSLIQRLWNEALGSTGPLLHASNRHSEAILSISYQWRCITWLWLDTAGSRGTAAPTKRWILQNWPTTLTHNRLRSEHQDRPRWVAANHRCCGT